MERKHLHFIQSLSKGLSVLQAFSAERPVLKLTQISKITGMNVTAAQRFTDTLMQLGFLGRNRHREFFLTSKVLSLGFAFLNGSQLKKIAEVYLSDLSRRLNRTVNLAVLDGDHIVFLYRKEAQRFLRYDLHAGSRLPSYCTASGKTLLAAQDDITLKRLIAGMELVPLSSYTITDPELLWNDLMETRKRGYAIANQELSIGLYSVGAPLINQENKVVAAVNLSLSIEEATGQHLRKAMEGLFHLGREVSVSIGYAGPYPLLSPAKAKGEI